jgi:hypothetical protein
MTVKNVKEKLWKVQGQEAEVLGEAIMGRREEFVHTRDFWESFLTPGEHRLVSWVLRKEWELTGWNGSRKCIPDKARSMCKGPGVRGIIVSMRGWKNKCGQSADSGKCRQEIAGLHQGFMSLEKTWKSSQPCFYWVTKEKEHQFPTSSIISCIWENALQQSVKVLWN